jgi:hypothetical protein
MNPDKASSTPVPFLLHASMDQALYCIKAGTMAVTAPTPKEAAVAMVAATVVTPTPA